MGWGQNPADARAAEQARREALERVENRPMSPFERKLIGVLEDIRDRLPESLPTAEPGAALPAAHVSVMHPDGSVQDFGSGTVLSTEAPFSLLLDSAPTMLAELITAGGTALARAIPASITTSTALGLDKIAEVVIEAVLQKVARDRGEEAGLLLDEADRPPHRLDIDLALAPASPDRIAERAWRGPGRYELASTAASTQVYARTLDDLAQMVGQHPVLPPEASPVQQQQVDESAGGEASPTAPPAGTP